MEQQAAATAEIARNVADTEVAANAMTCRAAEVAAEAEETGRQASGMRDEMTTLHEAVQQLRQSVVRVVRSSTLEVERL